MQILETTSGRAFVLCTSYRGMGIIGEILKEELAYTLFVQGEAPRHTLIDKFRRDRHSVLLGTTSFWQGVDVPGDALSCVIIDKLPFSPPGDPITEARIKFLRDQGRDAFREFQLPEAVMLLKQGVGRLIRSRSDRGLIALLDCRIKTRSYGRVFIRSLPEYRITHTFEDVRHFFNGGPSVG